MRQIWIKFDNKKVSRDWLDQNIDAGQRIMKSHKASHPRCLCKGEPGVPMYIAQRNIYYLAKMPGTGPSHSPDCPSYELPHEASGLKFYDKDAIQEKDDGTINISVRASLGIAGERSGQKLEDKPPLHRNRRSSIRLLGLLQLLWERSALNRWSPAMKGKRAYWTIHKYLLLAARDMVIKKKPLLDHLYIPKSFSSKKVEEIEEQRAKIFEKVLHNDKGEDKRMVVIGEVKSFKPSTYSMGVHLKHANLTFWMAEKVNEQYQHSFWNDQNIGEIDLSDRHIIVIMTVEETKSGNFQIREIASMETTKHFIPIYSSTESHIAQILVDQDRQFIKPMRYEASKDEVFPDFLLLDVGDAAVPMEVYGYTGNPVYESRKADKIALYKRSNEPHWYWDVSMDKDHFPPFPTKRGAS